MSIYRHLSIYSFISISVYMIILSLSICLSPFIHLFICTYSFIYFHFSINLSPFIHLSNCIYLFIYLIFLYISISIYLFIFLYLSIYLSPFIYSSNFLYISISTYPCLYLNFSIFLSLFSRLSASLTISPFISLFISLFPVIWLRKKKTLSSLRVFTSSYLFIHYYLVAFTPEKYVSSFFFSFNSIFIIGTRDIPWHCSKPTDSEECRYGPLGCESLCIATIWLCMLVCCNVDRDLSCIFIFFIFFVFWIEFFLLWVRLLWILLGFGGYFRSH